MYNLHFVFLFLLPVNSLRIHPEIPVDFSIQLCSHQLTPNILNHMHYLPHPISFCASMRSSKNGRNLNNDQLSTASLSSKVDISWRNVMAPRSCHLQFKGYQGEYRIWPDFGRYEQCQFALSRHIYELPESVTKGKSVARLKEADSNCPISGLPASYPHYLSCQLTPDSWHIVEWVSSIRYETFHNGSYGAFWSNFSTSFVFQTSFELERNGTEVDWLSKLIRIQTRSNGCDQASAFISLDPTWPAVTTLALTYRIRRGGARIYSTFLQSGSIDKWIILDIPLRQMEGVHEICAQITTSVTGTLRQRACGQIIDHLDCPFGPDPEKSSIQFNYIFSLLLLAIIFYF